MLRTPTTWAAPLALLAGFACANVQADEIDIDTFNAQNIAGWDLSVRENNTGAGVDRTRFPLHRPAVVGDWLRLNTSQARGQHAYATATTTLDPNLPISIRYEFVSWTDAAAAPRMLGFQLFDANMANSLDHFDYCGSKFALVRVMHGDHDGWASNCLNDAQLATEERFHVWGPGKSLLSNRPSPVKLACRDTQFVAIDKSWHCSSREEAIAKGFAHTVDAWLTPLPDGTQHMNVFIDGDPVDAVVLPATTAERLRFGFLSKAEGSAGSYAEIGNVLVSQSALFMAPQELAPDGSAQCMRVMGEGSHRPIALVECSWSPDQVYVRVEKMLKVGGYCLTVENNVNAEGARIISHSCYNGKNQQWNITRDGNIRSMMDGVPRCITLNGTQPMRLRACEDKTEQRFFPIKA